MMKTHSKGKKLFGTEQKTWTLFQNISRACKF